MFNFIEPKLKTTVADVMEGFNKVIDDLKAVAAHHEQQVDTHRCTINEASRKMEESMGEVRNASSLIKRLTELVTP